jgi:Rho-binding antiterminator
MDSNNDTYKPVSCDLHSQYELAIMHKNKLYLSWLTNGETITESNISPLDVQTKNHAEYLIAVTAANKNIYIRLDHIIEMRILS